MADYQGKVVAITGAGSGLGKGMVMSFAEKGAKLSLADINPQSLGEVEQELKKKDIEVITTVLDVTDYDAVVRFADKTFEVYGEVDYDINNAGIVSVGSIFKVPLEDWRRVFDIDVMGIVHGIKAFGPRMIAQDKEAFIINTASAAGLQANGSIPGYSMAKHAAVSVTESLAIELQMAQTKVKAFVFCPGMVPTGLGPNTIQVTGRDDHYYQTEEFKMVWGYVQKLNDEGIAMKDAMDGFFADLEADRFYIRTHESEEKDIKYRLNMVLNKTRPMPKALR